MILPRRKLEKLEYKNENFRQIFFVLGTCRKKAIDLVMINTIRGERSLLAVFHLYSKLNLLHQKIREQKKKKKARQMLENEPDFFKS